MSEFIASVEHNNVYLNKWMLRVTFLYRWSSMASTHLFSPVSRCLGMCTRTIAPWSWPVTLRMMWRAGNLLCFALESIPRRRLMWADSFSIHFVPPGPFSTVSYLWFPYSVWSWPYHVLYQTQTCKKFYLLRPWGEISRILTRQAWNVFFHSVFKCLSR